MFCIMDVKELCDVINKAPTFLSVVTISGMMRTICSYAEYDPETDEGSVWMYHGLYDIRKGKMLLDRFELSSPGSRPGMLALCIT